MRDAAGELADGLHLLGLSQLLLCLLAGGDLLQQLGRTLFDALLERCGQFRQRGTFGRQLGEQGFALDLGRLAGSDIGANADQRLDAAVGPIYRAATHVGPVQRTVGPDIAELDIIVVPLLDGSRDAFIAARAIVGMDCALQVLIRERSLRIASKRGFAGCRGFKTEVGQMQLPVAELPGLERGLQQLAAFGQIAKDRARLILPAPSAHRGADDADERGRMKRPLEEGDVAERLPDTRGVRIALRTAALMRQQHDRKIRPGRLTIEPMHEVAQVGRLDRLVRDHGKTGTALDLSHKRGEIAAGLRVETRFLDQGGGDGCVTTSGRQNDSPLG